MTDDDTTVEEHEIEEVWTERWPPVSYFWKIIVGALVIFALARALASITNILILILVSLVLAIGLQNPVAWLERKGMKRGTATALIFVAVFLVVAGFLGMVLPIIIREISELVKEGPELLRRAQARSGFVADLNERFDLTQRLRDLANELPGTALGLIRSLGSFVFNTLTVLILTIYFTTAMPRIRHFVARVLRREHREQFESILEESIERVGGYMVGQVIVSAIGGFAAFVALLIIGVDFPVPLAVWVALTALIPTVGALLGAIVVVAVAAFAGVPELIATIIYFIIYQQLENYVIAPRVQSKTVEISAPTILVAVLIGGSLLGFAGALLALPLTAMIKVIVNQLYLADRLEEIQEDDRQDRTKRRLLVRRRGRQVRRGEKTPETAKLP